MTTQQRNDSINLDLVSNSEKDISNFTLRVFAVMSSVNKQTVTYEEFLNFFQEKFNRPVKACDFGFTDLKELLLATEMVWIFDSVENQKSIVMRPLIQLLHELVEIMRKTKLPVGLTELAQIYNMTKQRELSCFKYGFPSLTKLLESLPMFISFARSNSMAFSKQENSQVEFTPMFHAMLPKLKPLSQTKREHTPVMTRKRFGLDRTESESSVSVPAAPRPPPFTPTRVQQNNPQATFSSPLSKSNSFQHKQRSYNYNRHPVFDERDFLEGPQMPAGSIAPEPSLPFPPPHFFERS
ncbi:uncharacterized protein LOC134854362 [Symsagittifera roscoffensis]|uniref:uncharacterized protein LOC134854362 n=1 Tax=Symsagittifera roscoffensis TaxID=84072 RepID=UPI00307C0EF9